MKTELLFTIVIPTFNREHFVVSAVESCLQQTYDSLEVIVVDDGGSDNTKQKLQEIKDDRVNYFYKKNEERGAARNYGIKKSSGDYILFLDSDDRLEPNCLKEYFDIIAEHNPKVLFSNFSFDLYGTIVNSNVANWKTGWYEGSVFLNGNFFGTMICFEKSHRDKIMFEESLSVVTSEDWIFNILKTFNTKFYFTSKLCVLVNEHDDRSMNSDQSKIIETKWNAMNVIIDNLSLNVKQTDVIKNHTLYFSAIHSYVEGSRKKGFDYLKQAKLLPLKKKIVLWLKLLVGRKILVNFKK